VFRNFHERIEQLKHHHQERADEVMQILSRGPKTVYQIAGEMKWDIRAESWEKFPIMQKWFAVGEAFAHVRYLHAAGFHCLVFDARGHGDSPEETLPVNVPEFAEDTAAAARWLADRPDVSAVGVLGHSMGAAGAIVAASHEPEIAAVVSLSAPADLVRMTRKTFEMAGMNIPEPIATPLAWFTAAILLVPRRHSVEDASAVAAAARYHGPLLLVHGAQDHGVPVEHLEMIGRAAAGRRTADDPPVETLVLPEFGRDPDGSSTNGFFNHRANTESTRDTWMMALGVGIYKPQMIERPIRHIDICPTMASLLGCRLLDAQGQRIEEIRS